MEYLFNDGHWHYSPIWVEEVCPLKTGKSLLLVKFFHAAYTQGVQDKGYTVQVLKRTAAYMLAFRVFPGDKETTSVIFQKISLEWLEEHFPGQFNSETDLATQLDRRSGRVPQPGPVRRIFLSSPSRILAGIFGLISEEKPVRGAVA